MVEISTCIHPIKTHLGRNKAGQLPGHIGVVRSL